MFLKRIFVFILLPLVLGGCAVGAVLGWGGYFASDGWSIKPINREFLLPSLEYVSSDDVYGGLVKHASVNRLEIPANDGYAKVIICIQSTTIDTAVPEYWGVVVEDENGIELNRSSSSFSLPYHESLCDCWANTISTSWQEVGGVTNVYVINQITKQSNHYQISKN